MTEVKWTEDLSVGIELIDEQHKALFEHINNLAKAVEQHAGPVEVASTLNFLIEYTDFHFSLEERNMLAHHYAGYADHKTKHDEFKAILKTMETEYRDDGPTPMLTESINTLLANWLLKHIRVIDVEFGAFLESKGIAFSEDV